jgi:uncharacterized phosphosugar-binding protein
MKKGVIVLLIITGVFLISGSISGFAAEKKNSPAYIDIYYNETIRIMNEMWTNEKSHLDKLTTIAAEKLKAGGKVVWDCTAGHSCIMEVDPSLPCIPKGGMISETVFSGQKETINSLISGDMLITNFINEQTVPAKDRGVYVVGVTDSYFRSTKFSAEDNKDHKPNYKDMNLEDISSDVLDSHSGGQIGLVKVPWTPEMKVGPGAGNFMITLYWIFHCETAAKMKNSAEKVPMEFGEKYMETVKTRLGKIYAVQKPLIYKAATEATSRVCGGAKMWVESRPKSAWCDASGASMGFVFTNHFPKEQMKKGDVIFIADSSDSTNSQMAEEAKSAKSKGLYIIGMGPSTQKTLKALSDVYIDNLSPECYGLFNIKGHENRIGLAGSLINSVVYDMFSMAMTEKMESRCCYPKFYMSYNWGGASDGYFEWLNFCVNRVGY